MKNYTAYFYGPDRTSSSYSDEYYSATPEDAMAHARTSAAGRDWPVVVVVTSFKQFISYPQNNATSVQLCQQGWVQLPYKP